MNLLIKDLTTGKEYNADSEKSLIELWKTEVHTSGGLYSETNDEGNPNWVYLSRYFGEWQLSAGIDESPFEPMSLNPERFQVSLPNSIPKDEVRRVLSNELTFWGENTRLPIIGASKLHGDSILRIASALSITLEEDGV